MMMMMTMLMTMLKNRISHTNINIAQQTLQHYLDLVEYNSTLSLTINNIQISTNKHQQILGITFDPKLNLVEHTKQTKEKADKTINILKTLTT